ncbi:MAG: hypothetical protein AAF968_06100 [Pseudomonadota bacterium]
MEGFDDHTAAECAVRRAQVDRVALEEFIEAGGVELLDALAAAAASDAASQFASLACLDDEPSAAAAEHALHTLKGTGASIGLARFAAEAERLLGSLRRGQLPQAGESEALALRWEADFAAFRTLCDAYRDTEA